MLYIVHPPGIFPASVRACLTRRRSAQREWVLRVVMEPADAYTTFEVFWRHCGSFVVVGATTSNRPNRSFFFPVAHLNQHRMHDVIGELARRLSNVQRNLRSHLCL